MYGQAGPAGADSMQSKLPSASSEHPSPLVATTTEPFMPAAKDEQATTTKVVEPGTTAEMETEGTSAAAPLVGWFAKTVRKSSTTKWCSSAIHSDGSEFGPTETVSRKRKKTKRKETLAPMWKSVVADPLPPSDTAMPSPALEAEALEKASESGKKDVAEEQWLKSGDVVVVGHAPMTPPPPPPVPPPLKQQKPAAVRG